MTDLEKIEDKYPHLRFWGIEVNNKHYHGHIEDNDVYINMLQPDADWLKTSLHETVHYDYDKKDLSDNKKNDVRRYEKWAVKESNRRYIELFDKRNKAN